jgi:hypothetical protein
MQWQNDGREPNRGTVLVASGNALFADIVGEMVARCGFAPAYLVGHEASPMSLARTRPCIVICDCAGPAEGLQRLIVDASSQRIPLVLSDTRMQQSDDVEALTLPQHVAWLTLPISRDAFSAMLDRLVPPPADVIHQATASVAGITIDTAFSIRPLSRVLARRSEAVSDALRTMDPPGSDNLADLATVELADMEDLRSAIATALAATPVYDQSLRRNVWTYVGAERDAGTSPGQVIMVLTELVDAARIVPASVERALTRRVILWCVEAYFGPLGGGTVSRDDSTFDGDAPYPGPVLVSNR